MGARGEQLARKFDESCAEFSKVVEGLSESDWTKATSAEQWPVGVVAHHLAGGHANVGGLIHLVAKAQPLPGLTWEMIHANNARHAEEKAGVTKAEPLALLKVNGEKTSALVRGLSDAELDRSASVLAGMPAMTAAQAIEGVLINHVHKHLAGIRATIGAK
jgi:mycothiol maleylpyruvate isomerase-like protein